MHPEKSSSSPDAASEQTCLLCHIKAQATCQGFFPSWMDWSRTCHLHDSLRCRCQTCSRDSAASFPLRCQARGLGMPTVSLRPTTAPWLRQALSCRSWETTMACFSGLPAWVAQGSFLASSHLAWHVVCWIFGLPQAVRVASAVPSSTL